MPILQIGPLALPVPALLILMGFWIGLDLTEKQASHFRVQPGPLYNMILVAILAGIIGARLAYAARAPGAFLQSPLSLFSPTPQMLDAPGGILIALLAAFIYIFARRMALWPTLDAATSLLSVLAVALGLANLASGSSFGAPTNLPWSIDLWGEARHPTQVYETIAALLIAAAVWPGGRAARHALAQPGFRLWIFLALSAFARLLLETFRGDSLLLANTFRAAQLIAWLVLAISLWQIGKRLQPPAPAPSQEEAA